MATGKLIVIEGTDGSGKHTQACLLRDALEKAGENVRLVSFPCYGQPHCKIVEMYLGGEFGSDPNSVNAYAASVFYAVDRFGSYTKDWAMFYKNGGTVICDRYTTSNAVHQAGKLQGDERDKYLNWLFRFEYDQMGIPSPDLVLYLDVPTGITVKAMDKRVKETCVSLDIHEQNVEYLAQCRKNGLEIAMSQGWAVIPCADNGVILPVDTIHKLVLKEVRLQLNSTIIPALTDVG